MHAEEIGLLLKQERGQFLEFLSAYEYRRGGTQKKRDEELAREIVRVLSGMANADGGTLLVGVEPDRRSRGFPHEPTKSEFDPGPQTFSLPTQPSIGKNSTSAIFCSSNSEWLRP
jgi:predicted HTH transcriptional regulator